MPMILEHVDVLIGNEEDAHDVLGIKAGSTNVDAGQLDVQRYPDVARQIADRFPSIRLVAFTLRESVSADHNNWGAVLWNKETDTALFSPSQDGKYRPYAIKDIVDRIGGGDAFSGGLLYGLTDSGLQAPLADALDFATAASCLCHSIEGDFNFAQKEDILSLMRGNSGGRVKR